MALPDHVAASPARPAPRQLIGALIFPVAFVIASLGRLLPFAPFMPEAGLDPSWVFGMNQAMAQGLVLGRDIFFTYGPYASVGTQFYHPVTDGLMMWGSVCFAMPFVLGVLLLFRNSHWVIRTALVLALVLLPKYSDALFFAHALFVGFFATGRDVEARSGQLRTIGCLLVLLLPFGLAPLVKGSFILIYAPVLMLVVLHQLTIRNWLVAAICGMAPLVYMAVFWVAAGQKIANLFSYLDGLRPITSGYTDAMSINGPISELLLFGLTAIFFGYTIYKSENKPNSKKAIQILIIFVSFLVALKAGCVRQDGHAVKTGIFLFFSALLIFNLTPRKTPGFAVAIFIIATFNLSLPVYYHGGDNIESRFDKTFERYAVAWNGLQSRLSDDGDLARSFAIATARIAGEAALPVLPGTSDIYSYGQSALIASGNQWNPRPVFQSYSAYTPALAEMNNAHLSGEGAPDNLFFAVQPIDGRWPALEDGLSWPTILQNYRPAGFAGEYLILKKQSASPVVLPQPLIKAQHALGEIVAVPHGSGPMFARIKFRKSIVGKIADLALKSAKLRLWVMLDDGTVRQYRLIAGMTETGFLISPLVGSAADFAQLYSNPGALDGKRVRSLSIVSFGLPGAFREKYEIAFLPLSSPRAP